MSSDTKTSKAVALWKSGSKREAIAIFHTFKLGFTKEEKELIKICHEMHTHSFYESLGYDKEDIKLKVYSIIESKYFAVSE